MSLLREALCPLRIPNFASWLNPKTDNSDVQRERGGLNPGYSVIKLVGEKRSPALNGVCFPNRLSFRESPLKEYGDNTNNFLTVP